MIKFAFKYYYLLRDFNKHVIIYINYKFLVHFLKFNMHNEIYNHWAVKLKELSVKIVYIKEKWNKIINELFRILFFSNNYSENEIIKDIAVKLIRDDL